MTRDEPPHAGAAAPEGEADARFGKLARGLAHELRNPLSTMKVNLQLLLEEWLPSDQEKVRRLVNRLKTMLTEVQRLEEVLQTFVDYAGSVEYRFAPVDLAVLLETVLYFLAPDLEEARIRVFKFFDPALGSIVADQNRLKQAFLNVLLNAKSALEAQGGELWVRTRAVEEDRAVVEFLDNGPGIAPEHRERIFEAYFSTKPRGAGLGLPICRRIVDAHGGEIVVESEPGKGTLVRIELPRKTPQSPPVGAESSASPP